MQRLILGMEYWSDATLDRGQTSFRGHVDWWVLIFKIFRGSETEILDPLFDV
jgi:hypothetical protein